MYVCMYVCIHVFLFRGGDIPLDKGEPDKFSTGGFLLRELLQCETGISCCSVSIAACLHAMLRHIVSAACCLFCNAVMPCVSRCRYVTSARFTPHYSRCPPYHPLQGCLKEYNKISPHKHINNK